jgi:hypothetical protein
MRKPGIRVMITFETSSGRDIGDYSVMVEDNGEVCYAYFLSDSQTTGFVWLYNRGQAPDTISGTRNEPVKNPRKYVLDLDFQPADSVQDFEAIWKVREGIPECALYLRQKLLAVVGNGDNPGWNINAKSDGPFALSLA